MRIKNANMPANPIIGDSDAFLLFLDSVKGGNNYGLTKLEAFVMETIKVIKPPEVYPSCAENSEDARVEWARQAIRMANTLLSELDKCKT